MHWRSLRGRAPEGATTFGWSFPGPGELCAQKLDVEQSEGKGDSEHDDRQRGSVTELQVLQQSVERVEGNGLGGSARPSTSESIDEIEHPERVQRPKNEGNQN